MDVMLEGGQLVDVAGNRVVLVITPYDLPKPCTDFDHAIMHSALKLSLYSFELRNHSLLRCDPPDSEGLGLVALRPSTSSDSRSPYLSCIRTPRKWRACGFRPWSVRR